MGNSILAAEKRIMIEVVQFTFNPFQENTFILKGDNGDCFIIDPGCWTEQERSTVAQYIATNELHVERLINTHCHIDHVLGNSWVCREFDVLPQYHQNDAPTLQQVIRAAHAYRFDGYDPSPEARDFLADGDTILLGSGALTVLHVPGHCAGHIALYSAEDGFLIGGDVLFCGSIGRTDLPGGDFATLERSIKQKFYTLPEDTVVYCGHGPSTNIGEEKRYNPYVQG